MQTGNGKEITCLAQNLSEDRATWFLLGTRDQRVQVEVRQTKTEAATFSSIGQNSAQSHQVH